jgi:aminoglycoside phosphotransferase family enzyme/predicted kinase
MPPVKDWDADLVAAMSEPDFYPDRPPGVECKQTHISRVFVAGESVYKIKKPVRFSFVDYSTLKLRYQFCQEEVRLNHRLAPRVYHGVLPIFRGRQGFSLGSQAVDQFDPEAVEYAVKMRRLPDEHSLERLVGAKQINDAGMRGVARILAQFHIAAARDQSARYGAPERIEEVVNGNLEECRGYIGEAEFERIDGFNRGFIDTNRKLFERRAADGMVRDGHGDLRCEHIYYTGGEIDVIDCVEFSEGLRYSDIASDVSFLLMDLDRLGAPALGHHLLTAYAEQIGDPALSRLLNFYKCFRAVVRGKVSSLKAMQDAVPKLRRSARETARNYFSAALAYAKAGSPEVIVVCGLPASGKSTIAKALAERSGFPLFNSDVIRKQLAGKAPTSRAGADWSKGIYSPEFTAATYAGLLSAATATLQSRTGAIIDATYGEHGERVKVRDLARQIGVPIVFVQCAVSDAEAKSRLDARARQTDAVSDATWEIYLQHQAAFAPFTAAFAECHMRVNGGADAAEVAWEIERFIANHY